MTEAITLIYFIKKVLIIFWQTERHRKTITNVKNDVIIPTSTKQLGLFFHFVVLYLPTYDLVYEMQFCVYMYVTKYITFYSYY